MASKFALFTKESKLPLNQGFQNRLLVTTVSRQAVDIATLSNIHDGTKSTVSSRLKLAANLLVFERNLKFSVLVNVIKCI